MARSIAEIYNELNRVKENMQELHMYVCEGTQTLRRDTAENLRADLQNGSKVAIWRLWLWIMAVASWMVENLFENHKKEIQKIISNTRPHTLQWYTEESKKFQYGYALTWLGDRFGYSSERPESQIISYSSASEEAGKILLKVAKGNKPNLQPLSPTELVAFTEYWQKWKDAGVQLEIRSLPADQISIHAIIEVDRMVLDSNNKLLRDPQIDPIRQKIDEFGASLEFDGIFRLSDFVEALKSAEGVRDVRILSAKHKSHISGWQPILMSVKPYSGYFIFDYNDSLLEYTAVEDNLFTSI
ncbi:MAG: hypothetical protein ACK4EX_02490 [Thermaurantimonas sp.]|uniref:hypothetical protein n=1 Tax=Thermaurantimonas sp. TaxID=2681568 RepID=UPI003918C6E9